MTGTQKQTVVIKAVPERICGLVHTETQAWLTLRPDHAPSACGPLLQAGPRGLGCMACEVRRASPTHRTKEANTLHSTILKFSAVI